MRYEFPPQETYTIIGACCSYDEISKDIYVGRMSQGVVPRRRNLKARASYFEICVRHRPFLVCTHDLGFYFCREAVAFKKRALHLLDGVSRDGEVGNLTVCWSIRLSICVVAQGLGGVRYSGKP